MPTTLPVNPRAECDGELVDDINDEVNTPGQFQYYTYRTRRDLTVGLLFICPCGCGELQSVRFRTEVSGERPSWNWDGNREKPTLTPSINILQMNDKGEQIGEHWHGYLTAGRWRMP
jgi:hypothetical protein